MTWLLKGEKEWFDEHFEFEDGWPICRTITKERLVVEVVVHPVLGAHGAQSRHGTIAVSHLVCSICLSESEIKARKNALPVKMEELVEMSDEFLIDWRE